MSPLSRLQRAKGLDFNFLTHKISLLSLPCARAAERAKHEGPGVNVRVVPVNSDVPASASGRKAAAAISAGRSRAKSPGFYGSAQGTIGRSQMVPHANCVVTVDMRGFGVELNFRVDELY
ncbi:hypothetical protein C8F04DRAFT_1185519 [Mycena alexandri]|uniref:Uncharacterized protein n=1 Tax=Mycena alexandri TaxID=1745969 RepID=A0AAD6SQ11_9AGAR|nr:hypothetical protein C8F04DRAFT_1185519 [Mycena alexandri]